MAMANRRPIKRFDKLLADMESARLVPDWDALFAAGRKPAGSTKPKKEKRGASSRGAGRG